MTNRLARSGFHSTGLQRTSLCRGRCIGVGDAKWLEEKAISSRLAQSHNAVLSALTFDLPHHITLESDLSLLKSSVDMPKLANAHLPANAFQYKDDVIIKGGFSFRSVLCLDVGVFASYFSSYSVFSKHDCVTAMIMFHPSSILNAIYTLENWSCMLQEAITLH